MGGSPFSILFLVRVLQVGFLAGCAVNKVSAIIWCLFNLGLQFLIEMLFFLVSVWAGNDFGWLVL